MESKSDSKAGEDSKDSKDTRGTVIDCVQRFCLSEELEVEFAEFVRDHLHVFKDSIDAKEGDEQPLSYYEAYKEYLRRFEKKIEEYIAKVSY